MRQQQMTRLIHSPPQLTHHQRQQLASCPQALLDHSKPSPFRSTRQRPRTCPHCCSPSSSRTARPMGFNVSKCRHCARTFNALTGTPWHACICGTSGWARHKLWARALAQPGGPAPGHGAKHRLSLAPPLPGLPKSVQARQLVGIAEADESRFLVSCKGQRGLLRRPADGEAKRWLAQGLRIHPGADGARPVWSNGQPHSADEQSGECANGAQTPCCHQTPSCAPMAASRWPAPRHWACSTRR